MIGRGHPLERETGVEFVGAPDKPQLAGVVPQHRGVVVDVGQVEKEIGWIPGLRAETQTRGDQRDIGIGFGHGGEEDGERVAVGANLERGTVVVAEKRGMQAEGAMRDELRGRGVFGRRREHEAFPKPRTRRIRTDAGGGAGLGNTEGCEGHVCRSGRRGG